MKAGEASEAAFERTFQRLVVPGSVSALDATIASTCDVLGATMASRPPVADDPTAGLAVDHLPRVSVREGGEPATRAAPAGTGPDLAVTGLLGEGGMGRMQLARQRSLGRDVALKRPRGGASDSDAAALHHEALVTGSLEHPNIVPIHALGRDDVGRPLIVMKRVEGVVWRALLHDDDHPGWASREPDRGERLVFHLGVLAQVANALAFAHQRGVIHRDIKPDNVMIGEFGEVYLLDWGLATRAAAAPTADASIALVGTPAYMAPEMVAGGPCDARTDVFLLGATLHEILTRRVRHEGNDLRTVLACAFEAAPVTYPDEVASELAELANRATARDPELRFATAAAFRHAVHDYVRHRGSLGLCAQVDDRLRELEAGLPLLERRGGEPADAIDLDRGIDECRFTFRQALAGWPDNRAARRGLDRCAHARVRLELARGNPAAARVALAELAEPPGELVAALAAAETERAAARAEHERLRRLEQDADPRIGSATRIALIVVFGLVTAAISTYAVLSSVSGAGLARAAPLGFAATLLALVVGAAVALRHRLLISGYNRRLVAWLVVSLAFLVALRAIGLLLGIALPQQLVFDLVGMACAVSVGAVFTFRAAWLIPPVLLAAAVLAALDPAHASLVFGIAAGLGVILMAVTMPRGARRPEAPETGSAPGRTVEPSKPG